LADDILNSSIEELAEVGREFSRPRGVLGTGGNFSVLMLIVKFLFEVEGRASDG